MSNTFRSALIEALLLMFGIVLGVWYCVRVLPDKSAGIPKPDSSVSALDPEGIARVEECLPRILGADFADPGTESCADFLKRNRAQFDYYLDDHSDSLVLEALYREILDQFELDRRLGECLSLAVSPEDRGRYKLAPEVPDCQAVMVENESRLVFYIERHKNLPEVLEFVRSNYRRRRTVFSSHLSPNRSKMHYWVTPTVQSN